MSKVEQHVEFEEGKKVLHLLGEIKHSGAEVMLAQAAGALRERGFILYALSSGATRGDYAGRLVEAGFRVQHLPFRKSITYFYRLYRYLRLEAFDVLHIHTERGFFWLAMTAKMARVPLIVRTVHNVFVFSGALRVRRMSQRLIARYVLGVTYIAVGPSVQEVEKRCFHNRTIVIPNWCDGNEFRPGSTKERSKAREALKVGADGIVLVSVGACSTTKNHASIIRAVAELRREGLEVVYVHLGTGTTLQTERELAQELGTDGAVRFLGQVEGVRDALIGSDVFVSAALHEGLPIAGLEAMRCGLPIVGYEAFGMKDIIEDGVTGMLVANNVPALTAGLRELVLNETLRVTMGRTACAKAEREFSMQRAVDELTALYGNRAVAAF